ncbi:MAG TPA: XRE family transcriptional regulator [Bacteroidia bacterium]|nr:XRE family transcriptional regulator [Bacteroidia bacterium]
MKKFRFVVERTRTGYSAYVADERYGIYTVGGDMKELRANMLEALNLYFEEEGKVYTQENIKVVLDLAQFFEFYKVINAKALSERIGMNQSLLAQYIKGIKTPSDAQVNRILVGIRELGKELSQMDIKV